MHSTNNELALKKKLREIDGELSYLVEKGLGATQEFHHLAGEHEAIRRQIYPDGTREHGNAE